jgi:hypothetical protein
LGSGGAAAIGGTNIVPAKFHRACDHCDGWEAATWKKPAECSCVHSPVVGKSEPPMSFAGLLKALILRGCYLPQDFTG